VNMAGGGCENGEFFLALEFVAGERLDLRIERLGRIPVNEVLFIGLRLLTALSHIHNRGYLYRDLKPENVIMTEDRGAVLFDYGICMPVQEAMTNDSDSIQGTPLYLPPERLLGEGEQARSEIYSLGMVLFHAATGHPFVDSQLSLDELKAVLKQHLSALRTGGGLKEILDRDLQGVIEKMIEREPHRRYQAYVDAERDLIRALRSRFRSDKYGRLVGV